MTGERMVTVNGQVYTVVISDEQEALLAASAAGRAIVGIWDRMAESWNLWPAVYAVERMEDADDIYLERVVRRKLGLPWIIGETGRLVIREFCAEDVLELGREGEDEETDRIFGSPDRMREYIKSQYGFYQYGVWALMEKETGRLIGKAGLNCISGDDFGERGLSAGEGGLELGYHVFKPYRRRGYAKEACLEIQRYAKEALDCSLYVKIDSSNEASIRLAKACGFRFIGRRCIEAGRCCYLYFWNCS